MATLTIRNLPDDVHGRLKEQAKRNRRSLNQEVIALLEGRQGHEDVERERFVSGMIAEAEAVYGAVKKPMTTEEVRKSIEVGREVKRQDLLGAVERFRAGLKRPLSPEEIREFIDEGRR